MTEKNYNPQQRTSKAMKKQEKVETKLENQEISKQENKVQEKVEKNIEEKESKAKEKVKKQIQKIKKDEAFVNGISLPISTKDSVAICKFIKGKTIRKAIDDLELVSKLKKAIPMKGEIPHRKGKGIMAGRYMTKPVGFFIRLLKSLEANSNMNGIEVPIIVEAVPNRASRPYASGGKKRKRTHIHIKAMEKNKIKKVKNKDKK